MSARPPAELDVSANGTIVELAVGDEITLRLTENPTTGFLWAVVVPDADVVDVTPSGFRPSSSKLGGGGHRLFRIAARRPGEGRIDWTLRRAWETDASSAASRFELTVRVRDA